MRESGRIRRGGDGCSPRTGETSGVVLERLVPERRGRKPWCALLADVPAVGVASAPVEPSELVSDGEPCAPDEAAVYFQLIAGGQRAGAERVVDARQSAVAARAGAPLRQSQSEQTSSLNVFPQSRTREWSRSKSRARILLPPTSRSLRQRLSYYVRASSARWLLLRHSFRRCTLRRAARSTAASSLRQQCVARSLRSS